jgi:hypothetical protein
MTNLATIVRDAQAASKGPTGKILRREVRPLTGENSA